MLSDDQAKASVSLNAWQSVLCDLAACLRFYSRLPVPRLPWETDPHAAPDINGMARVVPLGGAIIGFLPALILAGALLLDLEPWVSAALSVATMTLITGAFHEDGLADMADSFGGATLSRRLEIMKDSRLGSFGASALTLGFLLRVGILATLATRLDPVPAALVVIASAALSRTAGLTPLVFLAPARHDGASHAVGQPSRDAYWLAAILAAFIAIALGWCVDLPRPGIGLMLISPALTGLAMTRISARHLNGQTGDVAGATQQVAEIAAMLGLLIATHP
ncbi:adenosylcobinamide-GDP ribazoletransferase [Microvirga flavescens]|uniref:adenosylcobinamide-GDP ribazoletransferase n=1 Tax=Microvirga flavescens TaxID=2249811 RepID=UPI000DDB261E|nr:adenosylcobinamide-GDP ribazoletransferase [Microvirga flavescens]